MSEEAGHVERSAAYAAVVAAGPGLVVGLDFDGVLSPIVAEPDRARVHPKVPQVLEALAAHVRLIAVITGRPAAQALTLGLDEVGERLAAQGRELRVLGQYGNERWSSREGTVHRPDPPPGLAAFIERLPGLLAEHGAQDAWIEEKGLAVGVHTRRLADPQAAYDRLLPVLRAAAREHDLDVEPGRMVIEVRAPGSDKGQVVQALAAELGATGFLYAGDDLGDVPAFEAVARLREGGLAGLLVCSGSEEQQALVALADTVVRGPDGVLDLLEQLTAALSDVETTGHASGAS